MSHCITFCTQSPLLNIYNLLAHYSEQQTYVVGASVSLGLQRNKTQ